VCNRLGRVGSLTRNSTQEQRKDDMQKPDQWNTSAKSGVEPGSKLITSRIVDLDPGDLQAEFMFRKAGVYRSYLVTGCSNLWSASRAPYVWGDCRMSANSNALVQY
jgi:hypothetical protein